MTERELCDRVKAGERVALGLLYQEYAQPLFGVISRYLTDRDKAKDLLQDCFLKIFEKISQFEYQGEGSLSAWMTRLCINESLMQLRREKRFVFLSIDDRYDLDLQSQLEETPSEEEVEQIPREELDQMIEALPPGYRAVLILYLVEGKSHKEIAQMLGINEKSSSSQLARAKKQLAQAVKAWQKRNN